MTSKTKESGKITKPIWAHYFARKFSASRFEIVMRVYWSDFYWQEFKVRLNNVLVMPADGGNHAICYDEREWVLFANKIYHKVCRNLTIFKRYVRLIKHTQKSSLRATQEIACQPFHRLTLSQLGKLWFHWDKAHLEHFLKPIWIPFIIEPLLASDAKKLLERLARRRLASLAQDFETIFSPDEPNAISRERAGLLKLAIAIKMGQAGGKHIAAALREHAGLYGFIPCYDVIDKPWTVTHFQQELKVLLRHSKEDLRQELGGLETVCAKRQQLFRALLVELKPAKRERELLLMAHELAFIKDERDDYRRRMSFAIQPLFAELGRRAQVPSRATLYFIQRELTEWFQSGKLPVARRSLLERMKGYCLVKMGAEPIQIFSGRAMAEFLKTQKFREERTGQREIRGIIGNRGVARGPARIIFTKYDLRKVRPGDIMVAVTTHPDFVPAMRQCRAFVTDEGGITSHAAIVARELKLPCVVGTKNASKFLKDGEQVEVDADHGWVRKI